MSDKPDKYHYHEISDRCHIINSMIDDLLIGHPGMEDMTTKWCELAQRSITSVDNRATELKMKLDKGEA